MGTHPIFESDFDCLTDMNNDISQKLRLAIKSKLTTLDAYIDDELPDLILVMLARKKRHIYQKPPKRNELNQQTMKKKRSVQILDHLGLLLEVAVAQVQVVAAVAVGHVVVGKANQMHFMLVVAEKGLILPKPIEIQAQKGHIQRDFTSFQKRKKESIIVVEIEAEKIEDDVEDLQVQDHDQDLGEDQDRAIVDEEEGRLQAGQDHETDLVMGLGRAKRKFQKIQFEVENILQIQMRINQSQHEKTGSWIDLNVILVSSENSPWPKKTFERKMKISPKMSSAGMKHL